MANRILQIIPENGKVFAILIGEDGVERRLRVKMWALVGRVNPTSMPFAWMNTAN